MTILTAWKYIGETPLQAMLRAINEHRLPTENVNFCYTGRLDPMAQGMMVILYGDEEVKLSNTHFNLSKKTYRFQAILGISTTSYDPMGKIVDVAEVLPSEANKFHKAMLELGQTGKFKQFFPPCSAYKYKGQPLWVHAKNGTLPVIMPFKEREIYDIKSLNNPVNITVGQYRKSCINDMHDVQEYNGEAFKCSEIIEDWLKLNRNISLWRFQYEVQVSSGTYVRSLVNDIAKQFGIPAHAFRITRVSVDN